MWEFAESHTVWFFVYLSTICLTVSVVIGSLASIWKPVKEVDLDELASKAARAVLVLDVPLEPEGRRDMLKGCKSETHSDDGR